MAAAAPPYKINKRAITAAPPPAPPHEILDGNTISLVPLTKDFAHFDSLYAQTHNEHGEHGDDNKESVWAYMPYGRFDDADAMRQCYEKMGSGGDPLFYAVRHKKDNAYGGVMSYLRIAPAAYSIEVGHIWHAVPHQRSRANTEAILLLANNAFALGYRRLEWKCDAANAKSRAAALRLGFAFEGIFRQHCVFKEKNRDTAWFAILDSEWAALRANYEAWLNDDAESLTAMNHPHIAWSLPAHNAWQVE